MVRRQPHQVRMHRPWRGDVHRIEAAGGQHRLRAVEHSGNAEGSRALLCAPP